MGPPTHTHTQQREPTLLLLPERITSALYTENRNCPRHSRQSAADKHFWHTWESKRNYPVYNQWMTFISQLQHVLNTPSFTHDFNKTKGNNVPWTECSTTHNIKMTNKFSENVVQFKHLQIISTNENCMPEELQTEWIQGMHATIQSRCFVFSFATLKHKD